jgi:serine/threonine protein kinase
MCHADPIVPYSIGDRIKQYEIVSLLGHGGMGEVYRAKDTLLGREVAIKTSFSEFGARFARETSVIASLNHPNICTLLEAGPDYIVMELVEGPTLAERLASGPVGLEEAVEIARQIATALEAAHERGIVHRDLKPANVKIRPDGVVKVLDFGLAKGRDRAEDPAATVTMALSGAGTIVGTPAYMSPEQARGLDVDRRADIWAYGVVLSEMVTGKRLFEGQTATDILAAVVTKQCTFDDAPEKVRRLLSVCLEKDPKRRLRDIGETWRYLEAPPAPPAPVKRVGGGWLWPSLTAASLGLAAGTWGWVLTHPATRPLQVTKFQIQAPAGSQIPLGTPAISPDGRTIVYAIRGSDNLNHLHVRTLDSTASRELPGTEGAVHPFFSTDGKSIAFADGVNYVKRLELSGGNPRTVDATTAPWHGAWTTTGGLLIINNGLMQIPGAGGDPVPLTPPDGKSVGFPFFLRGGKRFLGRMQAKDGYVIAVAALDAPAPRLVLDAASAPLIGRTPVGSFLLYLKNFDLMAAPFDEEAAKVLGDAKVLVENIGRVATPPMMPTAGISDAGVLAYQETGSDGEYDRVYWFDRSGKRLDPAPLPDLNNRINLSPDGRAVAFGAASRDAGREEIAVTDLVRSVTTKVVFGSGRFSSPVWSPDGKRLAYRAYDRGMLEKNADGTGAERQLLSKDAIPLSYSPDGKYLLYESRTQLYLLSLQTDGKSIPINSGKATARGGAISPDGKFIAYGSSESGANQVYVEPMPPGTGRWQVSKGNGSAPRWRKDGKEIFYDDLSGQIFAVDVLPGPGFSVGAPKALLAPGTSNGDFDVSPDGQHFLVRTRGGSSGNVPITVVQNWWLELERK